MIKQSALKMPANYIYFENKISQKMDEIQLYTFKKSIKKLNTSQRIIILFSIKKLWNWFMKKKFF